MLYLVATPIGNLEDMTFRAVRILREVDLIAAEDTRHTRKLLTHFEIETRLTSYHEYSTAERIEQLVARLRSEDVALVSDAGMPGLSDPGYRLVRAAVAAGVPISPVPGATAAVSALVSSGLPTDSFLFLGFLPRQKKARQAALRDVAQLPYTLVLYESPRRVVDLLVDVAAVLGDREVCVGRELTKLYETFWRGTAVQAVAHWRAEAQIRGEFTVVIAGASQEAQVWDEAMVREALRDQLGQGATRKDAVTAVVGISGWRKKQVYALALQL